MKIKLILINTTCNMNKSMQTYFVMSELLEISINILLQTSDYHKEEIEVYLATYYDYVHAANV